MQSNGDSFTPGPWRVGYDYCDCGEGYGCPHGRWPFEVVGPARVDGTEFAITEFAEMREVDARLMAAAPSLVSLVERAVALDPHSQIALDFQALMSGVLNVCSGASTCEAEMHVHGCYADTDGVHCDDPMEHFIAASSGS